MIMSDRGRELLAAWEGVRLKPYRCAAGKPTIGVGHVMSKEEQIGYANGISQDVAMRIFRDDLRPVERAVEGAVNVGLKQHEFDALVSFTFNVGAAAFRASTLLRRLNNMEYQTIPSELMKWRRANGSVCKGLVARREREAALWRGEVD